VPGDDGPILLVGRPFQNDDQQGAVEDALHHETGPLRLRLAEESLQKGLASSPEQASKRMRKLELEVSHGGEGVALLVHQKGSSRAQNTPERSETGANGSELPGPGQKLVGKCHVV
jgi:hypothetical protein